jgi:hypothetical protein
LSQQYVGLVHSDRYTGNPAWIDRLKEDSSEALEFEEGRGREMSQKKEQLRGKIMTASTYRFWHTSFTGLYGVKYN